MPFEPPRRRSPLDRPPETLHAPALSMPAPIRTGRPKKPVMPPLPQEIRDGMSELEQEWFDYFIYAIRQEHPDLTPFDLINLNLLATCFISVLRMEARQLASGELITMARQDPRTQYLRLMDSLSVRRRDRKAQKDKEEKDEDGGLKDFLLGLNN